MQNSEYSLRDCVKTEKYYHFSNPRLSLFLIPFRRRFQALRGELEEVGVKLEQLKRNTDEMIEAQPNLHVARNTEDLISRYTKMHRGLNVSVFTPYPSRYSDDIDSIDYETSAIMLNGAVIQLLFYTKNTSLKLFLMCPFIFELPYFF